MGLFDKIKNSSLHLQSCPECGKDELSGGITSSEVVCQACGHETTFSEARRFSTIGGKEYDEEYIAALSESAEGETVNEEVLRATGSSGRCLLDYLDEHEQPHHILQGQTIDVEGGGDSSSLLGNDRSRKFSFGVNRCFTVVTNQRVFLVVQQGNGSDERHIPYDSITGIDLDIGAGGATSRLSIQTHGRTYHASGTLSNEQECRNAVEYIRHQRREVNTKGVESGAKEEPLEQLQSLKELRDEGVLSEDEFAEKKAELLERI
ncbi:PH domain-containing protein [Halorubellus sp. PRR65]|uniref:PH domain-containing protein n=1 Tax=Halorubellus sp. PRR65 TaxID=3098148 RepID=UPI002B2639C4|nr:PH domain-containing protein [Halorubellus sp. PRR65]